MTCVTTDIEIEEASKKAINALFGSNIENFKVREVFPYTSGQLPLNLDQLILNQGILGIFKLLFYWIVYNIQ